MKIVESAEIKKYLKSLSFGILQNSGEQIYQAHRDLYDIGVEAIPFIEEIVLSQSWQDIVHGKEMELLVGMLNLIHDIDEERSQETGKKIRKAGCSDIVDRRISAITTFTINNFYKYDVSGVQIFQSKKIGKRFYVRKKIEKLLSIVPKDDLLQIERLYIIPRSNSGYRGTYMPILCKIMIEWDMSLSPFNPFSWVLLLPIEKTLYHEIGHHVHRHKFGYDLDQEKEADRYAAILQRKYHPILRTIVRSLRFVIYIFKKTKK